MNSSCHSGRRDTNFAKTPLVPSGCGRATLPYKTQRPIAPRLPEAVPPLLGQVNLTTTTSGLQKRRSLNMVQPTPLLTIMLAPLTRLT